MLETCLVQHPFQNRPIIVIYYAHRQTAFTVFIIIIIFFYRRVSPDFSAFLNETEYPAVVCVCVCVRDGLSRGRKSRKRYALGVGPTTD